MLDLLSASILVFLGNVLDFRTYSAPNQDATVKASYTQKNLMQEFDRNSIPSNERMAICYARGAALSIFNWVRKFAVIKGPDGNVVEDLPSRFLVQILNTLLKYKSRAMQVGLGGAPHCSVSLLSNQVENMLKCDAQAEELWGKRQSICDDSLAFFPKDRYSVEWKTMPSNGEPSMFFFLLFFPI